ncbi:MAG: hypothetical protein JJ974_11635 [Phycisphaerales bacterium]|nr:hypothetical protein [Phycisphaerales bacterium]
MSEQIKLSMSVFTDFVSKSGQTKTTLVKQWKYKPDYSPATDFYRQVREALPDYCRKKVDTSKLDSLVANASPKRREHFEAAINGFMTWKKKKSGKWVEPMRSAWVSDRIRVSINPEIAYESTEGVLNIVKLYFRGTKLTKKQADLYLELMAGGLAINHSKDTVVTILDVKESSEYHAVGSKPTVSALLKAEAASWSVLWDHL